MTQTLDVEFGRYKLLRLLGEGGMAQVFHAVMAGPMGFEKDVAVKKLKPGVDEESRLVKALINEARLGGYLRHPNIVEIYEFNQLDGSYYLAMEYVDGPVYESVVKHYRKQQEYMSVRSVLQAMSQVSKGLHKAHSATDREGQTLGLIHRDLKPGNMMVDRVGTVKLMDFGIAKSESNLYKTTSMNMTKGTPVYMSPEQVRGEELTHRSDLWAMGVILYELISLRVLFKAPNLIAVMNRILTHDVGDAAQTLDAFQDGLGEVFSKCVTQDESERFEDADALGKALEEILADVPDDQPNLSDTVKPVWKVHEDEIAANTARTAMMPSMGATPSQPGAATAAASPTQGAGPSDPAAATQMAASAQGATVIAPSGNAMPPSGAEFYQSGPAQPTAASATMDMGAYERPPHGKGRKGLFMIVAVLVGVVVILGGTVAFLMGQKSNQKDDTGNGAAVVDNALPANPADVVAGQQAVPPADPATTDSDPAAADPKPADAAADGPADKPKDKPKETKSVEKPKAEPVDKPKDDPKPIEVVDKPKDVVEAPQDVVEKPSGTGTVTLNSVPWSEVYIDGKRIRNTPIKDYEISAGSHTVVFDCTSCDPPQKKTEKVVVTAGQTSKKIVRF
jgi:serine/threonine-protein kinase